MMNKQGNLGRTSVYNILDGRLLQPWYTIEVNSSGGNKSVTFVSRIHVNKRNSPRFSWSSKFSDHEILKDGHLLGWVARCYGKVYV